MIRVFSNFLVSVMCLCHDVKLFFSYKKGLLEMNSPISPTFKEFGSQKGDRELCHKVKS